MRNCAAFWILCALALFSGCNGHRKGRAIVFSLDFLGPLGPIQIGAGQVVTITYQDDDPNDQATTSFFADEDGDLSTTGDRIVIALNRPERDRATQTVAWDTTGVPPGIYRIFAVMTDGVATITFEAPGTATVTGPNVAPTLTLTGPDQPLTLARGACVFISYVDDDPDDVAATSLVADVDGSLATTGDSIQIEPVRPERDGQVQSLFWNSQGAPEGTYFIGGTTEDGVNAPVSHIAPGQVTLRNVAFTKRAGGIPFLGGSAVAAFPDGSCAVSGNYDTSFGTVTFGPGESAEVVLSSGTGAFLARYGADGALAWVRRAEGGDGVGVASFADGSCVVTGSFFGSMTLGPGASDEVALASSGGSSDSDLFVARYAANGALDWALSVGSTRTDADTHIAALADGSCIVAGRFKNNVVFGAGEANETTLSSGVFSSTFVARYNLNGTLAWARNPNLTNVRGLAVFQDGSYALLTQGDTISRYAADGSLTWTRTVAGMRGSAIAGLFDGSLAVTGNFTGPVTFGAGEANETSLVPVGPGDLFVARYKADGAFAWVRSAGGTSEVSPNSIAALPDGSCVVAGAYFGNLTFGAGETNETTLVSEPFIFNPAFPSQDLFVARFLPDGRLSSAHGAGGPADDCAFAVAGFFDCSFVATGIFSGTAAFGKGDARETTLIDPAGPDGKDLFVARYNADGGH